MEWGKSSLTPVSRLPLASKVAGEHVHRRYGISPGKKGDIRCESPNHAISGA